MEENWNLVFSSTVFLTNMIVAFWHEYYLYSFFFLCLTITSYWHHSRHTDYSYAFDKMAILSIVFYGGYLFYTKSINAKEPNLIFSAIIVAAFLATVFFYYGGYYLNDYCFHEDKNTADWFHSFLHIISSIGHHFIIIL